MISKSNKYFARNRRNNTSKIFRFDFGQWAAEIMPDDGARLCRLSYRKQELLTPPPVSFRRPGRDFGLYETRPVYGYDDCFPTVDQCRYPGTGLQVPDHGELCWLSANCFAFKTGLKCIFISRVLPLIFEREMAFNGNRLAWIFTVINTGRKALPFLHVMHPLMPVSKLEMVDLPPFGRVIDERTGRVMKLKSAAEVEKYLISRAVGRAEMLLLRDVAKGSFRLHFKSGLHVAVAYDCALFPTLGIWWNRAGYPNEGGLARDECAFEPIPGISSSLESSYKSGRYPVIPPRQSLSWQVAWRLST